MTKLLLTTALLAFLAVPAMADEGGTGVIGGDPSAGNYYTSTHALQTRLTRLQNQQLNGKQCYGNSNCYPIANAIAKTARNLAKAQASGCNNLYC